MVNKFVVFLSFLACSGMLISSVEAGKKKDGKEEKDVTQYESHVSLKKLRIITNRPEKKLRPNRNLFGVSTRYVLPLSDETTDIQILNQSNPNTVESLKKAGKTIGLVKPKKFRVLKKKSKALPSPW